MRATARVTCAGQAVANAIQTHTVIHAKMATIDLRRHAIRAKLDAKTVLVAAAAPHVQLATIKSDFLASDVHHIVKAVLVQIPAPAALHRTISCRVAVVCM